MRRLAIASSAASLCCMLLSYFGKDIPAAKLMQLAVIFLIFTFALLALYFVYRKDRLTGMAFWLFLGLVLGTVAFKYGFRDKADAAARYISGDRLITAEATDFSRDCGEYSYVDAKLKDESSSRALKLRLYYSGNKELKPGDVFEVTAGITDAGYKYGTEYDSLYTRGIFLKANARSELSIVSTAPAYRYFPKLLSGKILDICDSLFSGDARILIKSLLLGEKSDLYNDTELYSAMTGAGLMHTVAVSGMHIAFVFGFVSLIIGKGAVSSTVAVAVIWLFVLMTGSSPSAVRAGIMQTMLLAAPVFKRESDTWTSLSFALFLILSANPYASKSAGLQLSFAAVAGMTVFAERINNLLLGDKKDTAGIVRYLTGIVSSSVAVSITTIPVMIFNFGYISVLAPVSNLFCLFAITLCFCGGYVSCLVYTLFPAAARILAVPVSLIAKYICVFVRWISRSENATLYLSDAAAVYILIAVYIILIVCIFSSLRPVYKAVIPLAVATVFFSVFSLYRKNFYSSGGFVTALDTGQGQCLTAFCGDTTLVFDCGGINSSDKAGDAAVSYLKSCGRRDIDILVLTHFHNDHVNGVEKLFAEYDISRLVIPALNEDSDGNKDRLIALAQSCGCEVCEISEDTTMLAGGITVSLFPPLSEKETNESCLTGVVDIYGFSALVTGDSSASTERSIINRYDLSDTELVVCGHHGSRYSSSPELLEAANGNLAVICCGYNTYGHPTEETLKRLDDCGYRVFRTDLNGNIEFFIPRDYS